MYWNYVDTARTEPALTQTNVSSRSVSWWMRNSRSKSSVRLKHSSLYPARLRARLMARTAGSQRSVVSALSVYPSMDHRRVSARNHSTSLAAC